MSINASVKDELLSILIENSGNFSEENFQNTKGFGISNTKQRLHLLYGNSAEFKISGNNGKVFAQITIPIGGKTE